ncbi:484_t:CDS:2, partial [Dentiscutata erythropus]
MNTSGDLRTLIDVGEIKAYSYDDFSNIQMINKGGYGVVYSATLKSKGITIALKKLFANLHSDKKAFKEFVKEVQLLRKVDHHPIREIFLNIPSGLREDPNPADKKFDEYILKTEQRISGSNANIANLLQEFINLYIKDMVTNSDDTVNDTILAYFYMQEFGTIKDYKECLSWCKKGCEKKDIYSYYEAAFCHRYSLGTSEDYNEAFCYFNLAASGGILKAKRELAIMHMNGMGCEENEVKAFYLFKEAGEQDKIAFCMVSDCYYDGVGIEINLIEALNYYKICWKKWKYPNAIIRIPLIEKKL